MGMWFILSGSTALADYIDIFKTGEGYTLVTNNGDIAAKASNLETAQRYADLYTKRGAEVRWQSSLPARTTSGTVNPSAATTTGTSLTTTAKPGTNLPATTAKPGTNLPATTTGGGSNVPATTSGGSGGGNTGGTASAASRVNVGGAALGVIGMVSGAVGLYESTAGTDKATWADVGTGALSGAGVAAGAAAFVNAIPVGGQIAYGGAVLIGTAVGALGGGRKCFLKLIVKWTLC